MAELRVNKDSFFYGLLYSDFYRLLIYRYDELRLELLKIIESRKDEKGIYQFIDAFKSSSKSDIADNNRLIRDLDILIRNEKIPAGEISLTEIKRNNLISINTKLECLIDDLTMFRDQISNPLKIKGLKTFNWKSNSDKELPELYKRMIDGKFVTEIDFAGFKAIFTGQPVEIITNKLKWLKRPVLLAYFIDSIRDKIVNPKHIEIWSITKYCFENVKAIKMQSYNYQNNKTGKPKNYILIDNLLKGL